MSKINSKKSSQSWGHNGGAIHIIEKVHIYIQPNSLCKDRDEYISRAVMNVNEKLNLLDTWSYNTDGSLANVFIYIFA